MLISLECSPDSQVKLKLVGGSWAHVLPIATKTRRDIHVISFIYSKIVTVTGEGKRVTDEAVTVARLTGSPFTFTEGGL
jgi:hypothetical protein